MFDSIRELLMQGGWVMWPLLGLSVLALTLCFERGVFWLRYCALANRKRLARLHQALRKGEWASLQPEQNKLNIYSRLAGQLAEHGASPAVVTEIVERERASIERFMGMLSTIITVAPMLGILGTVTGIIQSFAAFGGGGSEANLDQISQGIAEALWSTAGGLVVAIIVLFPYNVFRAQVNRALGQFESLAASAEAGRDSKPTPAL